MAKKQASGKTYVSKGQRRNVSRDICNAMRREWRQGFKNMRGIMARMKYVEELSRKKDPKAQEKYKKILEEEAIREKALELYQQFEGASYVKKDENGNEKKVKCTYGAAVQAVKTDRVSDFVAKWSQYKQTS